MNRLFNQTVSSAYKKEMELLLLCARPCPDKRAIEQIKSISKKDPDWRYLLNTALFHKVHLLLYQTLDTVCPEAVNHAAMEKLKFENKSNAARSLLFSNRLLAILNLLAQHRIQAVPFKGPVLAERVYGDSSLRQSVDLDILVDKQDAFTTMGLLWEQGFLPEIDLDENQFTAYAAKKNSIAMANPGSVLAVDLHWEMSANYASEPLALHRIKNDLVQVAFAGETVLQPCKELLLIYLCLHGTRDCWKDLESLGSIAALIRSHDNWDWKQIIKRADRMHCRRMVLLTLLLVQDLFDVKLPQTVLTFAENDPAVSKLASTVCKTLFDPGRFNSVAETKSKFSMFHLKVRDTWSDRIRYMRHLIFGTTVQEWRYFPMPGKLSFLHGLLRPLRLSMAFFLWVVKGRRTGAGFAPGRLIKRRVSGGKKE
ncbi:MAG TPA: hypothetical protein ENI07_10385 [Desulfobacterales bacterium]|nr:hypothetical protein [Desulfobacterales bacterium]